MKMSFTKATAVAAVGAAALAIAAPASAATILNTDFNPLDLSVGGTAGFTPFYLNSTTENDQLDFSFDLTGGSATVLSQLQASLILDAGTSKSQKLKFDLYSGDGATGGGTFVAASNNGTGPSLDTFLAPGDYYLKIVTNPPYNPAKDATYPLISGAISAVPEPATWAMLLAGFAFVGYAVRRRKTSLNFA